MNKATHFMRQTHKVMVNEYKFIFKDFGVMLILFGAVVLYAVLYSTAYSGQVLYEVPVAIVDQSRTPASREIIRDFDASPNLKVAYSVQGLDEARELFLRRKVNGVILIPEDYERNILQGKTAIISVYADASYILIYKQTLNGAVDVINHKAAQIKYQKYLLSGASDQQAKVLSDPVSYDTAFLFNPSSGYGSFVMPGVLLLIMQQTLLVGIGMIGGTWRERRLYRKFVPLSASDLRMNSYAVVVGKMLAYLLLYIFLALIIFGVHYRLFGYPMRGDFWEICIFLLPYFLSAIFLGITLSTIFNTREESILILLFTSIPLLMISGLTWPKESIPVWLNWIGELFPSSSGIPGFLHLQVMGADLRDVLPYLRTLWILTGVYFITAVLFMRRAIRKSDEY